MFIKGKRGIIIAACCVFFAAACGEKQAAAPVASPLPPGADMALSGGVHFVETTEGAMTWDIRSKRATYSTVEGLLNFYDIKAAYFEKGLRAYDISGREGSYDSNKKIVVLTGDVLGKSVSGYTLKTNTLQYNLDTQMAKTDDPVEIRHEGLEIDGVGLIADFRAQTFSILDSARVWASPAGLRSHR